jgi:hypothetical protein
MHAQCKGWNKGQKKNIMYEVIADTISVIYNPSGHNVLLVNLTMSIHIPLHHGMKHITPLNYVLMAMWDSPSKLVVYCQFTLSSFCNSFAVLLREFFSFNKICHGAYIGQGQWETMEKDVYVWKWFVFVFGCGWGLPNSEKT